VERYITSTANPRVKAAVRLRGRRERDRQGLTLIDGVRETMRALGRDLTRAEFDATFGQRNDAILRRLVDAAIGDAEIARIGDEKEARYRALVAAQGIHPLAVDKNVYLDKVR